MGVCKKLLIDAPRAECSRNLPTQHIFSACAKLYDYIKYKTHIHNVYWVTKFHWEKGTLLAQAPCRISSMLVLLHLLYTASASTAMVAAASLVFFQAFNICRQFSPSSLIPLASQRSTSASERPRCLASSLQWAEKRGLSETATMMESVGGYWQRCRDSSRCLWWELLTTLAESFWITSVDTPAPTVLMDRKQQ